MAGMSADRVSTDAKPRGYVFLEFSTEESRIDFGQGGIRADATSDHWYPRFPEMHAKPIAELFARHERAVAMDEAGPIAAICRDGCSYNSELLGIRSGSVADRR